MDAIEQGAGPRGVEALSEAGARHLASVIAIDSASDERSTTIPSTEGQRVLSAHLADFFRGLGFEVVTDAQANLLCEVPGTRPGPKTAFLIHMDTSRGTRAVEQLCELPAWTGSRIAYPENPALEVSVDRYPETRLYQGEDLLFGPGTAPIGLDDKLGLSQMMTLAEEIARAPGLPRPDLVFVCRPDEEIGRMEALLGLADELKARGVRYGYTLDGLAPFEVNVENFNASMAHVRIEGRPLDVMAAQRARRLVLKVRGAKTHGATAKSEGYLNATVVFTRALAPLSRRNDVYPLSFASDPMAETDAEIAFTLRADDEAGLDRARAALLGTFEKELAPHTWKTAGCEVVLEEDMDPAAPLTDQGLRLFATLATFLRLPLGLGDDVPLLSEESDGYQGYSNPCFVDPDEGGLTLHVRLRAFEEEELRAREAHVKAVAAEGPGELPVTVKRQYANMGPDLAPFPELVRYAELAAERAGVELVRRPIRGGTGVDPFLQRGIPVANLGTGYFAPESEKELTSKQKIGQHVRWLRELLGVLAEVGSTA